MQNNVKKTGKDESNQMADVLERNKDLLMRLLSGGASLEDLNSLPMFREYEKMRNEGWKTTYIVYHLCDEYHLCERTVWNIIKHLKRAI